MRRHIIMLSVAILCGAGIAAGIAYATIPDSGGVYTGCMLKNVGTIRLIDPSLRSANLMSHCTSLETQISWSHQGQPGLQGLKGDTGATGATGSQGPKGDKGGTGATGDTGPQGPKGDAGATGATGPQGDKGNTGTTGPKGDTGASAYDLAFSQGFTGTLDQWLASLAGPKGDTGPQGPAGAAAVANTYVAQWGVQLSGAPEFAVLDVDGCKEQLESIVGGDPHGGGGETLVNDAVDCTFRFGADATPIRTWLADTIAGQSARRDVVLTHYANGSADREIDGQGAFVTTFSLPTLAGSSGAVYGTLTVHADTWVEQDVSVGSPPSDAVPFDLATFAVDFGGAPSTINFVSGLSLNVGKIASALGTDPTKTYHPGTPMAGNPRIGVVGSDGPVAALQQWWTDSAPPNAGPPRTVVVHLGAGATSWTFTLTYGIAIESLDPVPRLDGSRSLSAHFRSLNVGS